MSGCSRPRPSRSASTTARLAEPLHLVHPVTIAHASGTTPTPITNRQHHHGDGDDHHHDVYEDERGIFSLSTAGLGLLIFVRARNTTGVADAIAAGYQCAEI